MKGEIRVPMMRGKDGRMTLPRLLCTCAAGVGTCLLVMWWWPFTIVVVVAAAIWMIREIRWLRRVERELLSACQTVRLLNHAERLRHEEEL
jgi:hypothetical protein